MTELLLVMIGIASLLGVAVFGRGRLARLGPALGTVLEVIGATVLLFVANLTLGVALVLVARRLSIFYTTLYEVTDLTVLIVSLVQALTVTAWQHARR